jgi:hypothetical protein
MLIIMDGSDNKAGLCVLGGLAVIVALVWVFSEWWEVHHPIALRPVRVGIGVMQDQASGPFGYPPSAWVVGVRW